MHIKTRVLNCTRRIFNLFRMRNNAGRSEPRVTLLISNFMRRFDTKTRLWNGFSAMHGGYSAPLWVPLLGDIDSADVSGFYKRQRVACGSKCLTHLRAPGAALFVFSFPFFFSHGHAEFWPQSAGNISPKSVLITLDVVCMCVCFCQFCPGVTEASVYLFKMRKPCRILAPLQ